MDWYEIGGVVVVGLLGMFGFWKSWVHIPRKIGESFIILADAVEDKNITVAGLRRIVESPAFSAVIYMVRKAIER